jgi:hypothetical protein
MTKKNNVPTMAWARFISPATFVALSAIPTDLVPEHPASAVTIIA